MKKLTLILTAILFSATVFSQSKVAVIYPFDKNKNVPSNYEALIQGKITGAIVSANNFDAFTRADIDKIIDEVNFQNTGMVKESERQEIGNMTGATHICVTNLTASGSYVTIVAKIINITTGKIVATATEMPKMTPPEIIKASETIANKLLQNMDGYYISGDVNPDNDDITPPDDNDDVIITDNDFLLPVYKKTGQKDKDGDDIFKYGFIDKNGKLVVNYIYDYVHFFSEGLAWVSKEVNDKRYYGFINSKGKVVAGIKYSYVRKFSEGLAYFEQGNRKGYLKKDGTVAFYLPDEISSAREFSEGVAVVFSNNGEGIIDKNGNYTLPLQEEITINGYHNGLIPASKDNKYGYIDKYGTIKIPLKYDAATIFSEGLAAVKVNDLWGFINTNGNMVTQPNYYTISYFSEGICRVYYSADVIGYIDKNGNDLFIDKSFTDGTDFHNGLAVVNTISGKTKVINTKGEYIRTLPFSYDAGMYYIFGDIIIYTTCLNNDITKEFYTNIKTGKIIWQSPIFMGHSGQNLPNFTCFPQKTQIQTPSGNIEIQNVRQGMQVLSYNPKTKQMGFATVKELQIHTDTTYQLTKITFINNNLLYASINNDISLLEIEATENHPILTTKGLKKISEINETDTLLYYSEFDNKLQKCTILNINRQSRVVDEVYNIILENGNLYIANGLIASPKCPLVYVKQGKNYVFIDEIIKNQISKKLDRYDNVEIPQEMIKGNTLTVKISEEKDEISYLDHIYLQVGKQIIKPVCKSDILQKINVADSNYHTMQKGESFELIFNLPKNIDKSTKIKLVAKGYYEPINN